MAAGIRVRHRTSCRSRSGGGCNCKPAYEAWAFSNRERKKIRKTFANLSEAKGWRADATTAIKRGTMQSPTKQTVGEAADAWLEGARAGTIRNLSGDIYKPSAIRGYEEAFRLRIKPELGQRRLSDVRRIDVQDLADRLLSDGLNPSTIRNTINALRVLYKRAREREEVAINPTERIRLPAVRGRRERFASPQEAAALLEALPEDLRGVWATAFYAGLRRGELKALRWSDIDLDKGIVRVERGWDDKEGEIATKSRAGKRNVPILSPLRRDLIAHKLRMGRSDGLVFGLGTEVPFTPSTVSRRAHSAWKGAGLDSIGLHEARHSFASMMIAAGVNAKAISTYMGHASVQITYDRYGHLMPGNEREAAARADEYLEACERA